MATNMLSDNLGIAWTGDFESACFLLAAVYLENGEQKLITTLMMTFVEYFGSCLRTFKFSSKISFYR